jgi:hypothetical protein|uniref:Uncharacterized protein n=1 Tax=Acanthoceras zachariasii TaxID=451788 RepID=A0A2U9NTH9_9STRA|nr:hypothetical protein ycf90 [Acanthoceras zachariasii]AWT40434.1 hypothetical protein ycf90 [Acanthoceras zachariasii]
MQILLKLFLFLIDINQETPLDFFGLEKTDINLESTIQQASVSNEITVNSLKSVFQNIIDHSKTGGLGLVDIENIIFFITFIRFVILAIKYNLKTSFYISGISLFASLLWYFHIRDMGMWYEDILLSNRLTTRMAEDMGIVSLEDSDIVISAADDVNAPQILKDNPFLEQDTLDFLKTSISLASEKNGHRIDPISMLISAIPENSRTEISKLYYLIFSNILPNGWDYIDQQLTDLLPLVSYLVIVRLNKKYCPYLIRWHWTFIFVNSFVEIEFVKLTFRLWTFQNFVLIPQGRLVESTEVELVYLTIITLHYLFNWFGLLHAMCGQYFYIPFIVENTEIHIGKRPLNSIYSGGYTAWQNENVKKIQRIGKVKFPRLWWGWFGRANQNIDEQNFRKKQQKLIRKKGFKNFIKKFKKWILRN